MNDLAPPVAGMKVAPFGLPEMLDAWVGLLHFAIGEREVRAQFKAETGHDLDAFIGRSALDVLIDQATGHDREAFVAFCDWVTVNMWGDGTDPHEITVVHTCQCDDGGFDHEFETVDDSFDHEYGTHVDIFRQCVRCGETAEYEPDEPDLELYGPPW